MTTDQDQQCSLVEASIEDLQRALSTGAVSCVELVSRLLHRISTYDCRGIALNSIPIINPDVFTEAAASDQRRTNGKTIGLLDGIPYTIKDSYMVKGMTVGNGSIAFQDLVSSEDAFVVSKLRDAGAILIGRSNMPPMADSGVKGVYGRAESPYNLNYLAAAFASGSSVGSAVATAASFASFSLGGETVSSGRSPASNNALVAYNPSRGGISIRGDWPLYPTCDIVVPFTRTVDDMLMLLDTIAVPDEITSGDFWRDQPFVKIKDPWAKKPQSLLEISNCMSLAGVHLAVPVMYVGGSQLTKDAPVHTSPFVSSLWQQAKSDLERLGARVTLISSFPVLQQYDNADAVSSAQDSEKLKLPDGWQATERSALIAHGWESFLKANKDPHITSLSDVRHEDMYPPFNPDDLQNRFTEPANRIRYEDMASYAKINHTTGTDIYDLPQLSEALNTLERMREVYFEDWMTANQFDCVVFPAAGDVAATDADIEFSSAEHAWRNGVKYSNGGRALRHLGIPSVTVPMGIVEDKGMPVGLTFCGRSGSDVDLLRWGKAYETGSKRRHAPRLVPALATDKLRIRNLDLSTREDSPELIIDKCVSNVIPKSTSGMVEVEVEGHITIEYGPQIADDSLQPVIEIVIDASPVPAKNVLIQKGHSKDNHRSVYEFSCRVSILAPPQRKDRDHVASRRKILRDSTMVVVLARSYQRGRPSGCLRLL